MRSDEEDDEEDYYDDNEEDDEQALDVNGNGIEEDGDEGMEDGSDEEGSDDEEGDGEEDEEADEDEDEDVDVDAEDDEEEDNDDEDEEEDDDEDEAEAEGEGEDVDMTMDGEADETGSVHPSQRSKDEPRSPLDLPAPPHLVRRSLFTPSFTSPPSSLSIETIVGIPLPSPVHALASTSCLSYLLAGSQDGHVRAYDFWASVNGGQMMTAQQRGAVGLGETVSKAGVGRGWWSNSVEGTGRVEPVYSMACESDGLWTMTGTRSGPINLYTLRHAPGHLVHSLKGHTNVVSCISVLPSEKGLVSGSWDGTVREWDLNTGQTVRTYPTHGAQLSSISFRPFGHPPSPSPSPREPQAEDGEEQKTPMSISMGPDFFEKRHKSASPPPAKGEQQAEPVEQRPVDTGEEELGAKGDIEMSELITSNTKADTGAASPGSIDSLFGDDGDGEADAEGETAPPSKLPTASGTPIVTPSSPSAATATAGGSSQTLGLALPGQSKPPVPIPAPTAPSGTVTPAQPTPSSSAPFFTPQTAGPSRQTATGAGAGAAANIPLLSSTSYRSFSEDVLLTSSMDGQVVLIDRRVPESSAAGGVGRLLPGDKAPPWCMSACWSGNGTQVLAGRRNGTIDIWDVRRGSSSSAPNLLRTLRTPAESGPISCLVAFPDGRHIASASQDNIRLWNTAEYFDTDDSMRKSKSRPPFKIIAGHHGGTISSMIVDPTNRFLISASGDRGWQGESTKVVLIHEVKW